MSKMTKTELGEKLKQLKEIHLRLKGRELTTHDIVANLKEISAHETQKFIKNNLPTHPQRKDMLDFLTKKEPKKKK